MLIANVRIVETGAHCELRADIHCATHWVWGDAPFPLFMRFPSAYRPFLSENNGDPFLAACLPPAMVLGESLQIECPVSAQLLGAVEQIQEILRCWDKKLNEVRVEAPLGREPRRTPPGSVGLFFSMGVDSSYSLLKNVTRHAGTSDAISHLILIEGCDVYLWESQRFGPLLANVERVAQEMGKTVLPVTTNLRDFSDRMVDWVCIYHGAALACIALALGGFFRKVHIASTRTYANLVPLGTHPLLDPLWSTEETAFVHDGCEADRLEKIRAIAGCPGLVEKLRVCTTGEVTDSYNCGRCEKCVRTMIGLYIAGALQHCRTLPRAIDPDLVRTTLRAHLSPLSRHNYEKFARIIGDSEADRALKQAIEECLQQI